jgi:hypothetical protein
MKSRTVQVTEILITLIWNEWARESVPGTGSPHVIRGALQSFPATTTSLHVLPVHIPPLDTSESRQLHKPRRPFRRAHAYVNRPQWVTCKVRALLFTAAHVPATVTKQLLAVSESDKIFYKFCGFTVLIINTMGFRVVTPCNSCRWTPMFRKNMLSPSSDQFLLANPFFTCDDKRVVPL